MLSLNVEAGMFTHQSSPRDSQVQCHNVARIHSQPELGTWICKSDHDNCFSTVPPQQIYKNSCFFFLISLLISYLPSTVAGKEHNTAPPSFVSFFPINVGFSFILQQFATNSQWRQWKDSPLVGIKLQGMGISDLSQTLSKLLINWIQQVSQNLSCSLCAAAPFLLGFCKVLRLTNSNKALTRLS